MASWMSIMRYYHQVLSKKSLIGVLRTDNRKATVFKVLQIFFNCLANAFWLFSEIDSIDWLCSISVVNLCWQIDELTKILVLVTNNSTITQVSDLAPNKRSQQTMMRAIWYKWLLDFLSTHVTLFKSTNVKPTSTKRAHEWGKRMIRGEWKMFFQIYLYFFFCWPSGLPR